jgi:7-keto-8-aminopelargonate synthetase-like enzyme
MSKAFGSVGGFVVADRPTINLLRHYAPSYTSSRGSPPAVAAASLASVGEVTRYGRELRAALWNNIERMRAGLSRAGVRLGAVASPVIPVLVGSEQHTLQIGRHLMSRGVLTSPMVPPAVPPGGGMLRIGVTARHSVEDVDVAVRAITECVAE